MAIALCRLALQRDAVNNIGLPSRFCSMAEDEDFIDTNETLFGISMWKSQMQFAAISERPARLRPGQGREINLDRGRTGGRGNGWKSIVWRWRIKPLNDAAQQSEALSLSLCPSPDAFADSLMEVIGQKENRRSIGVSSRLW